MRRIRTTPGWLAGLLVAGFATGALALPKEMMMDQPFPERRVFQVPVERLWTGAQTPPVGWTVVTRDTAMRFVVLVTTVDQETRKIFKPYPHTLRDVPQSGLCVVMLLAVPRGDAQSEIQLTSRMIAPSEHEEFFESSGNLERFVLDKLGERLK
jgi:hypothetical protein